MYLRMYFFMKIFVYVLCICTYGGHERCIQGIGGGTWCKESLERPGRRWEDNIKIDLQEVELGNIELTDLAQDRDT